MSAEEHLDLEQLHAILDLARREDLGSAGDVTSALLPQSVQDAVGRWRLVAREPGRFCGHEILPAMLVRLAPQVSLDWPAASRDGADVAAGSQIATLSGPVRQMLAAERILLNFLQRLSGVATLTARFVAAVAGTQAKIYDTRKTTPGFRMLEKYAVRCGGGRNHRQGLHDAVLIKDNHLAGIQAERMAHAVFEMLNRMSSLPGRPSFVEVECDGLDQLAELLKVISIDVVLLDNFGLDELQAAVRMRDAAGLRGRVELEASGRVTLENVRRIAETGVERISVGAITHSAPILDLGLDAA